MLFDAVYWKQLFLGTQPELNRWDAAHQFEHWYLLHSVTLVLEATTGFSMQATMHATK